MLINYISIQLKGLPRIVSTVTSALLILTFSLDVSAKTTAKKISSQDKNHFMEQVLAMQVEQNEDMLVTMQVVNMNLTDALKLLAEKLRVGISFHTEVMPDKKVSLNMTNVPVYEVLFKMLEDTGLEPVLPPSRDVIVIREKEQESKEIFQERVRGTIKDARTGELLPGVNIIIAGTTTGTTTNLDGQFELEVPNLQEALVFTYIGYERLEVSIEGRNELNIELVSEIIAGDELIVVGYGAQRRSELTGSVSSINRRDIIELPVYSMDNVLQGLSAGVQVTADGFRPGQESTIRIRGERSFSASNDPLVVLDGVPMEGGLTELNPRDVESIEILKDASATAIYGSRGANGVILVTTRRGHEGLSVEYSGFAGVQKTFNRIDMMNTAQYAEFVRDAHRMNGTYTGNDADLFTQWQLEAIAENRTTDWQDLVFDTGFQQNHSLSIRGGSENTRYSISGTFDDHQATVTNNDFQRISTRVNLDQTISSRLRTGISAHLSNSLRNTSVSFARVVRNSPMSNPFDSEGNIVMYDELGDRNPFFDMQRENNLDERSTTRVIGTIYAEADIIPDRLSLRTNFSPDFRFRNNGFYRRNDPASSAGVRERRRTSMLYEAIMDFRTVLFESHRLHLTSMYSVQNFTAYDTRLEVSGLPYEHQLYHNLGSAEIVDHWSSSLSEWTLESYMLRTNYVYDNRYLFTLTGRVDGSSRLAEGNKYGLFPSMAFAWQIGNEHFMNDVDFISELKLRFSIGEVGNTAISPYQTQGVLDNNLFAFSGETVRFFEHGDIPNPDLKWETTRSMDLGLDFGFLDNRVRGSIDIYQSDTYDLIMNRQLPFTSGYSSTLENVGDTRNRGIEFEVSSVNIQNPTFMWSTDFNIAANRNEIVSLYGGKEDDPGSGWFIGQPINVHYYWKWDGIWQLDQADEAALYGAEPGDVRVVDVNGDGVIDDNDRVILGSPFPKWTAGLTNRIQYRNIDFSIFVHTVQGTMHRSMYGSANFQDILSLQVVAAQDNQRNVDYWTPDNPSNEFERPRFGSQSRNQIQAYFDTSFIRVRNMTLGYSISQDILSRLGARHARIYASIQNPFTITSFGGYDPEGARGYDMPNYTTFLLGIDLSF